ncbi:MAG: hypothetical protein VX432_09305 [Candidatus Poribacteria bacterium]|nr:hypothetical protein [Candidatus Poribacteria bacterium]
MKVNPASTAIEELSYLLYLGDFQVNWVRQNNAANIKTHSQRNVLSGIQQKKIRILLISRFGHAIVGHALNLKF